MILIIWRFIAGELNGALRLRPPFLTRRRKRNRQKNDKARETESAPNLIKIEREYRSRRNDAKQKTRGRAKGGKKRAPLEISLTPGTQGSRNPHEVARVGNNERFPIVELFDLFRALAMLFLHS